MTDQTTVPPNAHVLRPDAVFDRLEADAAAFLAAFPGPRPVARLVWEAANLGYSQGCRDGQGAPNVTPGRIVADVLNHAAARPNDADLSALHALAHAGQRARAHVATAASGNETTTGGNCDG